MSRVSQPKERSVPGTGLKARSTRATVTDATASAPLALTTVWEV